MRPIEFRGMTISGEWVYGYYVNNHEAYEGHVIYNGKLLHIIQRDGYPRYYPESFAVKPETIGQFIGLLDKNGAKIYENDIIKAFGIIYKVEFNMGAFHFVNQKYNLDWRTIMNNERIYSFYNPMFFEKVGNIHQNKELIKESK
jgi:uncharacterized phage protein (TIGR01671 family)